MFAFFRAVFQRDGEPQRLERGDGPIKVIIVGRQGVDGGVEKDCVNRKWQQMEIDLGLREFLFA